MHILIIPSEQINTSATSFEGIFQLDQARALRQETKSQIGFISVKLKYSLPMLVKGFFARTTGRSVHESLVEYSAGGMIQLAFRKFIKPRSFITQDTAQGFNVVRIEGVYFLPPSLSNDAYGWTRAGFIAVQEYIRKFGRPDIIHAHNALYAGILAARVKEALGIPFVITEHSTYFARQMVTGSLKAQSALAFQKAEARIAVSPPFCQLLHSAFQLNWTCVPNVLDSRFEKMPASRGTNAHYVLTNIASLDDKKGHKFLLEAFARKYKGRSDVQLKIGGSGDLRVPLEQLCVQLGIQSQVEFMGQMDRAQVFELLAATSVFVLPSLFETFGVVVIEALALGKPVIATRCGGPESILSPELGILIPTGDVDALVAALDQMERNLDSYNPEKLREICLSRYGAKAFASQLFPILQKYALKRSS